MGPKAKDGHLGRSIIKARFGKQGGRSTSGLHTTTLSDGVSWVNNASITEQNDLEELLHVAQLAGTEFTAERASPLFVQSGSAVMDVSVPDVDEAPVERPRWLRIPRRPHWTTDMSPDELHMREQDAFLEWRRELARLEDSQHFILTPFERNLEIWRQLWRVVEACSLIVQIVDARNPLLFYCEDLCEYMLEMGAAKRMLVLINKSDYLTEDQRKAWAEHLTNTGIAFVFFSAKDAADLLEAADNDAQLVVEFAPQLSTDAVLGRGQLLSLLKNQCGDGKVAMIGYPNVGKSSTINALAGVKRVSVAATPGKTKHFQTIILDNGVTLYDCPGLVMPNFAVSKADLVLNGILPIDQLRDWVAPVDLMLTRIPRNVFEATYGIELPRPTIDERADRLPTYSELLSTFAAARGFRTSFHGNPDESRAARIVLKDFVSGKLLYCMPPPEITDDAQFNAVHHARALEAAPEKWTKLKATAEHDSNFDREFATGVNVSGMSGTSRFAKPIFGSKKHHKGRK